MNRLLHTLLPKSVLLGVLTMSAAPDLFSLGDRFSPRGVGMARTVVALSRGLEAAGINPANLPLSESSIVELSLAPFGFHGGGEVLSYDIYNRYFTGVDGVDGRAGRSLSEQEKLEILGRFSGGFATSYFDADARLLGVGLRIPSIGFVSFTVTDYAGATAEFPEDYVRFMFLGNPLGSSYDFNGSTITASWLREYSVSYGGVISEPGFMEWISIGGAAKLINGFAYYELLRSNTSLVTSPYGVLTGDVDFLARFAESSTLKATGFDLFPKPAGEGWGIDLGLSGGLTRFLSFGISVTDIGTVSWESETQEVMTDTTLTIDNALDPAQQEVILDAIGGEVFRDIPSFKTSLPTVLRVGVAVQADGIDFLQDMPGDLLVGLDYHQGLVDVPGSPKQPRFSFGTEYTLIPWLPLRGGVSVGGTDEVNFAFGFGVHAGPLMVDVGTDNLDWMLSPEGSSFGSFSAGLRISI